jgi:hypothetical protein
MSGIKWGSVERPLQRPANVVIVASGPSVNNIDMHMVRHMHGKYIIAVNGAGKHVSFADAWFTLDPWGLTGDQLPAPAFGGKLFAAVPEDFGTVGARCVAHRAIPRSKITYLHRLISHNYSNISSESSYKLGLSEDTSCINTGNSGFGALNLAYHMRPVNIFLLGVDGGIGYFYSKTERNRPLTYINTLFGSTLPQLSAAGIKVYNVSPSSKVTHFEKLTPNQFHEMIRVVK